MPSDFLKNDSTDSAHSLDKTNQLIEYVESLVATNEQQASSSSFLVDLIDERFSELADRLERQINGLFETLTERLDRAAIPVANATLDADPTTVGLVAEQILDLEESAELIEDDEHELNQLSAWDRRKRELLAEHGQPLEPLKSKTVKKPAPIIPPLDTTVDDKEMDALHESIESINSIDAEEIEVLKEQLTSKLRDAEVELSINRAKLSQQWASLEQRQYEIAQREATFASKYGSLNEPAKKQGLLDRLSRHLSRSPLDE